MRFRLFTAILGMTAATLLCGGTATAAEGKDLILKDDARCTSCHDEADAPGLLRIGRTKHGTRADGRTPTCTSCHGASDKHASYDGKDKPPLTDINFSKKSKTPAAERNGACRTCHQGGKHINWEASAHAVNDVTCASCHTVHGNHDRARDTQTQTEVCFTCHKEQRAQMNRPNHHPVPEGKMACSSCHNVHGDNPKQLVRSSTNETCYECHMEKRGPFVHNHQPVSEDCGICHQPHGTITENLLKSRMPFLCQECHSHTSHPGQLPTLPGAPTTSTTSLGTVARGCTNCHTNIHGGNSTQNSATAGRFRR